MKKLQNYLKLLSLGSVIVLAMTTISCNINNSNTRNNLVIPTTNKNPNNNLSPGNNTAPENSSSSENSTQQQPAHNNDQGSSYDSNNSSIDIKNPPNEIIVPSIDNSTRDASNNNQTYFSTISNVGYVLTSLDNKYLEYQAKDFQQLNVEEQQIEEILLNDKLPLNFYSHPKYKPGKQKIFLNPKESIKLKLIDAKNNTEITNEVKWYQRLKYPESKVLKAGDDKNDKLTLSSDGTVTGKAHQKENDPTTLIWAEYKGYLYPFFVEVPSEHHFIGETNKEKARKVARDLANKWRNLPVLEQITKAYEWMTKEVKYDPGYKTNSILKDQTAYSALVEKCTVCTGYAKGFKMIMEELSIPCIVMEGQSSRDFWAPRHAWNLIEVDGEWYHVDPTSDRTHSEATFNFFFNSNDDFKKMDNFDRNLGVYGSRFRNYKDKSFVHSKEETLALIDNQISDNNGETKILELTSDNFINVNKAFEERHLKIEKSKDLETKLPFRKIRYTLKDENFNNIKTIKAKINLEEIKDNHLGKYALKVTLNSSDNIEDLKPKNFNVKNAMVKEVKKINNGYILFLDHFTKFGSVEMELESIKRQGYKFDLDQSKFTFKVEKHTKPNISLKIDKNNRITLIGSKKGMQYRSNMDKWTDITSDDFIINNPKVGKLSIRWKDYDNKFASDIQLFDVQRANDVVNKVKLVDNMLIGLDNTIEYKKETDTSWTNATTQRLILTSGTYWIRTKASGSTLASDISKVEIKEK
ncbi:MAG6410 family transglutaminase-related lipoprotein [Mycoplasma mycoides]|uniref:MAG6410 family transglutaminase-related lipoprotein n=1 Tax=Mycoplasma mycoides TaxID=2102 RepID=UPI00223E8F4A|nr:transglutaminase domain-containing protein [Mycoplasma mycoides]QVK07235.1 lipoprotein [Mycoplasma mycoides subsp. capri]